MKQCKHSAPIIKTRDCGCVEFWAMYRDGNFHINRHYDCAEHKSEDKAWYKIAINTGTKHDYDGMRVLFTPMGRENQID